MTSTKNEPSFARKSDYLEIRALWDKIFDDDSDAWRDWYFKYIYKPANCAILKKHGRIVSMSHMNPYPMMLNSKQILSAALAGVATEAKERGQGYAGLLIEKSLIEARAKGVAFSFLYPFDYDFYRKYGYELCYENKVYKVFSKPEREYAFTKTDDSADTSYLYEKYCANLNGHIIRAKEYQKVKLKEHLADGSPVYLITEKGKSVGYALAEDKDGKVIMSELVCEDPADAAKALSRLFTKPVEFSSPFEHPGHVFSAKPHCMGRITNVIGVFDGVPAKDGEMVVRIIDGTIKENDGNFLFVSRGGKLEAEKTDASADITADIKEMSAAAVGFSPAFSENVWLFYNTFFKYKTPWISEVC